jgi:hypothetical protein
MRFGLGAGWANGLGSFIDEEKTVDICNQV